MSLYHIQFDGSIISSPCSVWPRKENNIKLFTFFLFRPEHLRNTSSLCIDCLLKLKFYWCLFFFVLISDFQHNSNVGCNHIDCFYIFSDLRFSRSDHQECRGCRYQIQTSVYCCRKKCQVWLCRHCYITHF